MDPNMSVLELARRGKQLYQDRYLFRQWLKITVSMFRSGKHVLSQKTTKKVGDNSFYLFHFNPESETRISNGA